MSNEWVRVTHRTIIEESTVTLSLERLTQKFERFGEQWEGFTWLLSRSPEQSSRRRNSNGEVFHLMHRNGDSSCGLVEIAAVYKFDDKTVTLIEVNAWEVEEA